MCTWRIPSHGDGTIYCRMWEPAEAPRGILQIVHGISEHCGRYHDFACFLADHGILVVANDHMGHGHTTQDGQVVGHFYGGWEQAVDDVEGLRQDMARKYPGVPYYIMGHSMGSFLVRTLLFRHGGRGLAGAILSGTGWTPKTALAMGRLVCKREIRKKTLEGHSPLMQKMMFDGFNLKFHPARTPYDWVAANEEAVDSYIADPYCATLPTLGLVSSLLWGLTINERWSNLRRMRKDLPVYFFSGGDDPVGGMGKGVRICEMAFKRAGCKKILTKLYPTFRHEMLNELCKTEVYNDILAWIDGNLQNIQT